LKNHLVWNVWKLVQIIFPKIWRWKIKIKIKMGWLLNTPGPSNSQKKERTTQIWYIHVPTNCINKLYFLGAIIDSWIYHKTAISLIGRLWSWKLGPQDWSLTLQVMSLFYVRWSFLTWYIIKSVWRFYGRKGVIINYIRVWEVTLGVLLPQTLQLTKHFGVCFRDPFLVLGFLRWKNTNKVISFEHSPVLL
jgi:hypothetical protein